MGFNWSSFAKIVGTLTETPAAGAESRQSDLASIVQGGGFSLGNSGGWSNSFGSWLTNLFARRGITVTRPSRMDKHAVGDASVLYGYVYTDGGISAASDEGQYGLAAHMTEYSGYFHGTVSATTGTGDTAPVLAFSSGNNWTTDGGYLLNISKGTLSGTLSGASTPLSLVINSGTVATFLNKLPVSGVTLPISTAIGIATAAIANPGTTRDNPVLVTVVVNLAQIGGVFKPFTVGSVVSVAGFNYPEQSIIQTASAVSGTNQQTLTLKVANPNSQAILFQGGIQGQYISATANLALSGQRSAYFAFGSLLGTDMIYGNQVTGGVTGNILPNNGCEAWQASGANSAWHLYPGAEVAANTDQGFACKLEQNGVVWAVTDLVECTHFPTGGGTGALFVRIQNSPSNAGFGMSGIQLIMNGAGIAGGNTAGIRANNQWTPSAYRGSGGPLQAPQGIQLLGTWANSIYISNAPDNTNEFIIFVSGNNTAASNTVNVIGLNFAGGGNLTFDVAAGRWHVDRMDSSIFSSGGTPGLTTTTGGLTFSGGILTAGSITGGVTTTGSPASGNLAKFSGAASIVNGDLSGDVTTSGTLVTTITNSAVTLAKIANAAASSKLLGSGATGSGAAYAELTLGTNLSMSGTTINAAGSSTPFTVVQEAQFNSGGSNTTSFSITFPVALAASGNTAFLIISCDGASVVTIPAGWTSDFNQQQSTFARLILCHKATAGDTSATITVASTSSFAVYFFELVGSHVLDQSSTAGSANTNTIQTPTITPSAGSLVFAIAALVTTGGAVIVNGPVMASWNTLGIVAPQNGGRGLAGLISRQAATNVSTKPPAILIPAVGLFGGGGVAYATFSIL